MAFQNRNFEIVGRMFATMIFQGGELPRVLSSTVCKYIEDGNIEPKLEEVVEITVRNSLKKVSCIIFTYHSTKYSFQYCKRYICLWSFILTSFLQIFVFSS